MNTYVPVRKIIKVVSTHRTPKRERHSSLQECLDSSKEPRRKRCRWKPWIILSLFSSALYYIYVRRAHFFPEMYERTGDTGNVVTYVSEAKTPMVKVYALPKNLKSYRKSSAKKSENRNDTLDAAIELRLNSQNMPFCFLKKTDFSNVVINKTSVNLSLNNVYPHVKKGGYYRPPNCKPRHKVGIVVPYRDRIHNLGIFLYNIHPFLMKQKLEYQIFVIEQEGYEPFNKGRIFNAGFKEMMKFNTFNCLILHDLDLLPMDPHILYTCPTLPRHMCAKVNDTDVRRDYNISYEYKSIFGGVVAMTVEQFERANGYSNLYFGWGGEDNDMFWRLSASGYPLVRYKNVGVYTVLPHKRETPNPFRHHLISRAVDRYKKDGLSNIEYYVISTKFRHLYTHIVVNINPREDNITELNNKFGTSLYKV